VVVVTRTDEASEQLGALFTQRNIEHSVLNARQDQEEAAIVAQAGQPGRITVATNMAGRGTDIKLAEEVSENGGLHVILTEYHESARVDRQLFGRCARQGEPGTVEAMVCIEDELFRRYAATLSKLAAGSATQRGKVSPLLLRALVRVAQALAESHNRGIRMSTLKQDKKLQQMLGFSGTPS